MIIDLDAARKPRSGFQIKSDDMPNTVQVLALDPGGTTGWCLLSCEPLSLVPGYAPYVPGEDLPNDNAMSNGSVLKKIKGWQFGQVDCGATKGNLGNSLYAGISTAGESAGAAVIARHIRAWPGAAVVVESFILRQFSRDQDLLSPQRITAKIEQYLWLDGREYFTQTPSEAKVSATDERLKEWGFYSSDGGMQHARDATRHAITFLRKASVPGRKAAELRAAAWPHFFGPGGSLSNL